MTTVEEIERAILQLSDDDMKRLRHWLSERDWEQWDREIEEDSKEGRLDFLVEEAKKCQCSEIIPEDNR